MTGNLQIQNRTNGKAMKFVRVSTTLKQSKKEKNTNITTRVIPYGSDNLTIASVNNELLYLGRHKLLKQNICQNYKTTPILKVHRF